MTDRSERAVLNHLIETCTDAERGFRAAAEQVTNPSLKSLLQEMAAQRARFAADLLPHAQRLGGASGHDGTTAGAIHRGWINVRHTIGHEDAPVVREAERGEHFALGAYREAIEGLLPPGVRDLVESQYVELQEASKRLQVFDHPVRTV